MSAVLKSSLELQAGRLRLALRPDLGGAIAGLWSGATPVLRSTEPDDLLDVREAAAFSLVPFSNRIARRRFEWQGQARQLGEAPGDGPNALHGLAWQRPWRVAGHSPRDALLTLSHAADASWPFDFELRQSFTLGEHALDLRLEFTNTAALPAPVGLGWHPYFPLRARSRVHAQVSGRWEPEATRPPARRVPQSGLDTSMAHLALDHCFDGWDGHARIRDERLSLTLSASLGRLVLYASQRAGIFAVEPVSHVPNAINMADPARHGLRTLQPGETTTAWMKLEIEEV